MVRKKSPSKTARMERRKAERDGARIEKVKGKGGEIEVPPHIIELAEKLKGNGGSSR